MKWGTRMPFRVFGASHAESLGIEVELPLGTRVDTERIAAELVRRRPADDAASTKRREADIPIFTGIEDGIVTGPVTIAIRNTDARPRDYALSGFRPGHADYPAWVKYGTAETGGGVFSGRMTAAIVMAGAIVLPWLEARGVHIHSEIVSIGEMQFPGGVAPQGLDAYLDRIRAAKDSVGSKVRVVAEGVPAGLGSPMFGAFESIFSSLLFAVPAVKAIGFGDGEGFAGARGSEVSDPYIMKDGKIAVAANHNGGILGGLTTGAPITCTVTFKPPSSIGIPQRTVDRDGNETVITVGGRHDVAIAPRGRVVLEAALALAIWEGGIP